MDKIKVVIFGCGVMGSRIANILWTKDSFEIVGALDIAPDLVGKDLGELMDHPTKTGIKIESDADKLFSEVQTQAAVLTTTSYLKEVYPQIIQCLNAGLNVISTSEELSFPWKRNPELARDIDKAAVEKGVTVVGTGINPGFLMDTLPLFLTAPCLEVSSIKVIRMMNSSKRRIPFQKKVGTGMSKQEFEDKIKKKIITGHVGLLESIYLIADGLSWKFDEVKELPPQPVLSDREITTGMGTVKPGYVIGLTSIAYALKGGKKLINLEFNAHAGVEEEYDEIIIKGKPDIHQKIIGGVHGDIGTVAVTINTIPRAVEASAGLKITTDLPPAIVTS